MNYQQFKEWVLQVTELYGADKDLAPHLAELLQIINSPFQENNQPKCSTIEQIRAKLFRIVQIAGSRDKPLIIRVAQGESAGEYYDKFGVKRELEEFIESYPKYIVEATVDVQIPLISKSQPQVSTQEVAEPLPLRKESQQLVHDNPQTIAFKIRNIVHKLLNAKEPEVNMGDREWHKLFIERTTTSLLRLPQTVNLTESNLNDPLVRSEFQAFIGYHSIYNSAQPRPDLNNKNPEELMDYSIQLALRSDGYASKVNYFKTNYIKAAKNMELATQHQQGLAAIKNLIENHSWKLGSWGSCSKIEVNGVPKEVPKHIYQIYKKIENVEKNELEPSIALTEIGHIADHALKNPPTWFKSLRGRAQETKDAYTEISKLTPRNN